MLLLGSPNSLHPWCLHVLDGEIHPTHMPPALMVSPSCHVQILLSLVLKTQARPGRGWGEWQDRRLSARQMVTETQPIGSYWNSESLVLAETLDGSMSLSLDWSIDLYSDHFIFTASSVFLSHTKPAPANQHQLAVLFSKKKSTPATSQPNTATVNQPRLFELLRDKKTDSIFRRDPGVKYILGHHRAPGTKTINPSYS